MADIPPATATGSGKLPNQQVEILFNRRATLGSVPVILPRQAALDLQLVEDTAFADYILQRLDGMRFAHMAVPQILHARANNKNVNAAAQVGFVVELKFSIDK